MACFGIFKCNFCARFKCESSLEMECHVAVCNRKLCFVRLLNLELVVAFYQLADLSPSTGQLHRCGELRRSIPGGFRLLNADYVRNYATAFSSLLIVLANAEDVENVLYALMVNQLEIEALSEDYDSSFEQTMTVLYLDQFNMSNSGYTIGSEVQLKITDGPTLYLISDGNLLYCFLQIGNLQDCLSRCSFRLVESLDLSKPLQSFTAFCNISTSKSLLVTGSSVRHHAFLATYSMCKNENMISVEPIDVSNLYYESYYCAGKCIFIQPCSSFCSFCNCFMPSSKFLSLGHGHSSRPLEAPLVHTLLLTNKGILLHFYKGKLHNRLDVGPNNATKMSVYELNSRNSICCIITTADGIAHIVNLCTNEIIRTFESCDFVCGDFIGCGFKQLILYTSPMLLPEEFLLTDFHSIEINRLSAAKPETAPDMFTDIEDSSYSLTVPGHSSMPTEDVGASQSLSALVKALDGQTNRALEDVRIAESSNEHRCCFITSQAALINQLHSPYSMDDSKPDHSNNELMTPECESGLVDLLPSVEPNRSEYTLGPLCAPFPAANPAPVAPLCSALWRHIVDCSLVVGVTVQNTYDHVTFGNIGLSLVCDTLTLRQSFSHPAVRCAGLSSNNEKDSPSLLCRAPKQPKLEAVQHNLIDNSFPLRISNKECAHVTCHSEVPTLSEHTTVSFSVLLHWTTFPGQTDGDRALDIRLSPHVMVIGRILVTPKDLLEPSSLVFSGDLSEADMLQSRLVLDGIQTAHGLTVTAERTDLSHFHAWIMSTDLRFSHCAFQTLGSFIMLEKGPLHLVRVKLLNEVCAGRMKSTTFRSVHLQVHTRNQEQLMLFLHRLYSVVPPDVLIVPVESDSTHLKSVLGHALRNVTSETAQLIHTLDASAEQEEASVYADQNGTETQMDDMPIDENAPSETDVVSMGKNEQSKTTGGSSPLPQELRRPVFETAQDESTLSILACLAHLPQHSLVNAD